MPSLTLIWYIIYELGEVVPGSRHACYILFHHLWAEHMHFLIMGLLDLKLPKPTHQSMSNGQTMQQQINQRCLHNDKSLE